MSIRIGACQIRGDTGAHLSPVSPDLDFVNDPVPVAVEGDIQQPSGDLLYREIAITTIAQYQRPMIELDADETLSRIFSGFGTRLSLADFSPVPNTRRYLLNPTRRWSFRAATYSFSVRTATSAPAPVAPVSDAGGPYTARAAVEHLLPSNLPRAVGDADFERWIANACREIDAEVGRDYPVLASGWKFDAQPDTPPTIAQIAQWLSASHAYGELKEINRVGTNQKTGEEKYRSLAMEKLTRIRRGEIEVESAGGQPLDTESPSPILTLPPTPQFVGETLDQFLILR